MAKRKEAMQEVDRLTVLVDNSLRTRGASLPDKFLFHPKEDRLYFIGGGTLQYSGFNKEGNTEEWSTAVSAPTPKGKMSREEELLRERMRVSGFGITDYTHDEK